MYRDAKLLEEVTPVWAILSTTIPLHLQYIPLNNNNNMTTNNNSTMNNTTNSNTTATNTNSSNYTVNTLYEWLLRGIITNHQYSNKFTMNTWKEYENTGTYS